MMANQTVEQQQDLLAGWIASSKFFVIFTGAGISTESGIPDFRGPDGLWRKTAPDNFGYQNYLDSPEYRRERWEQFLQGGMGATAEPNPGHRAVADLVNLGYADCVITQNVDGLHARSGVPDDKVFELHGSSRFAKCLGCWQRYPRQDVVGWPINVDAGVPLCPNCGGLMKSGGVSFGEPMPEREVTESERRARRSDLFMVVGSSLVVYPAAFMPVYAHQSGAKLVIINIGETTLDRFSDLRLEVKSGEFLPGVVERVRSLKLLG
jgi:NAD-dependent deacetylase